MRECICSNCGNLKGIVDESSETGEIIYECEFGFPSDKCEECEDGVCEEECSHFVEYSEPGEFKTVKCKGCGKELSKLIPDNDESNIFCVDCFLKQ